MIKAYAEMIGGGALGPVTENQREGLAAIGRGTATLTRLARDLTDMSLLDRDQLPANFEPSDLGEILEEIAVQVSPFVTQRNQQLSISVETGLVHPRIDRDYLGQAILNVVMNAVRFTADGGAVDLSTKRVPDGAEIAVTDTGIGIPKEDQEKIFARPPEPRNSTRRASGWASRSPAASSRRTEERSESRARWGRAAPSGSCFRSCQRARPPGRGPALRETPRDNSARHLQSINRDTLNRRTYSDLRHQPKRRPR